VTGEIDICANVLPIGGLNAKLLGAITAGVKKALIPIGNKKDYEKFVKNYPEEEKKIEVILIENVYETFEHVFINNNIVFDKFL
jgi:ATP-dependent Lon protease